MTTAFIVQCFAILVVPYVIWRLARLQRVLLCVIVQILVGICLGPNVFGRISPLGYDWLFQGSDFRGLSAIAALALLIFSFTTGLHADFSKMRRSGGALLGLVAASVTLPSLLGAAAGYLLIRIFPHEMDSGASPLLNALSIGCCCGVTALPVLAAILRELRLIHTQIGQLALVVAAFSDGALWLMIAPILSIHASGLGLRGGEFLVLALLVVSAMVLVIGPALRWIADHATISDDDALIAALAIAIASAALTEACGLHFLLGAFLGGAIMPQSMRASLHQRLEMPTLLLLMPFFFTLAGLRTTVQIMTTAFLPSLLLLTGAAVLGKVAVTMTYGKLIKQPMRYSLALGILLQSKGLTEVVLVTILLEGGLITPTAFSILIVMGLVCTIITAPFMRWVYLLPHNIQPSRAKGILHE